MSFMDLLPPLLHGAGITIQLTVYSAALAFVVAVAAGIGRLSKYKLVRIPIIAYIEFFRGTSLLVQLFWIFFVLPLFGITLSKMMAGVLALGLNYGAYGAEVVRGAIQSVPKGQTEAGIALNMTPWQRMRRIIFPQAFVMMIPPFGNLIIELLKGTALVSLIGLYDMTYEALLLRTEAIYMTPIILGMLLVLYFVIAFVINTGMRWLERKAAVGRS
ncbi:ectoine/hydroxyectoine ABC transporter permease subunit EhuC [Paenibacillus turpanensis]|uniref:ectoine/hydroxyectoine ABC transporter permease subunit EhuC n=1 Tax=Paenibacillus turpanensis TaxID=2689078 RepID=UPI0014093C39|nr:ectoine/hydroxyectoine ABC transporter permease subunit EhuC [Paenibacillus turpanensis]